MNTMFCVTGKISPGQPAPNSRHRTSPQFHVHPPRQTRHCSNVTFNHRYTILLISLFLLVTQIAHTKAVDLEKNKKIPSHEGKPYDSRDKWTADETSPQRGGKSSKHTVRHRWRYRQTESAAHVAPAPLSDWWVVSITRPTERVYTTTLQHNVNEDVIGGGGGSSVLTTQQKAALITTAEIDVSVTTDTLPTTAPSTATTHLPITHKPSHTMTSETPVTETHKTETITTSSQSDNEMLHTAMISSETVTLETATTAHISTNATVEYSSEMVSKVGNTTAISTDISSSTLEPIPVINRGGAGHNVFMPANETTESSANFVTNATGSGADVTSMAVSTTAIEYDVKLTVATPTETIKTTVLPDITSVTSDSTPGDYATNNDDVNITTRTSDVTNNEMTVDTSNVTIKTANVISTTTNRQLNVTQADTRTALSKTTQPTYTDTTTNITSSSDTPTGHLTPPPVRRTPLGPSHHPWVPPHARQTSVSPALLSLTVVIAIFLFWIMAAPFLWLIIRTRHSKGMMRCRGDEEELVMRVSAENGVTECQRKLSKGDKGDEDLPMTNQGTMAMTVV